MPLVVSPENVEITDNVIFNPVNVGIFFGADRAVDVVAGMELRNLKIARNRIVGHFIHGILGHLPPVVQNIKINKNHIEINQKRDTKTDFPTVGISLRRGARRGSGPADSNIRGISITKNTVKATGAHAGYSVGGIYVAAKKIQDLEIADNTVACHECKHIQGGGIRLVNKINYVGILRNRVVNSNVALSIDGPLPSANIRDNAFCNSQSRSDGQITFLQPVKGKLLRNVIKNGEGAGVACRGGDFSGLAITENRIIGNRGDAIQGCEQVDDPIPLNRPLLTCP